MYYYIEGKAIRLDLYTRCLSVHAVVLLANNKQARSRINLIKFSFRAFPFVLFREPLPFPPPKKLQNWQRGPNVRQSAKVLSDTVSPITAKYSLVGLCLTDNRVYYYSDASLRKTGQTDIVPSVYCIILIVFK